MNLFSIPDPISMFESAKNSGLEREAANAFVSAAYSGWISFLWRLGRKNLFGLGPALRDAATAQYKTLSLCETRNFLRLSVPVDLLATDNLSHFESEWSCK